MADLNPTPEQINIFWFRQDLRISDNPALLAALATGRVIPIFILDEDDTQASATETAHTLANGSASRWWLHHSLVALDKQLGGKLQYFRGDAKAVIDYLVALLGVRGVYWNRCYDPKSIARDTQIKSALRSRGIEVSTFNGSLLWEPWEIAKQDGSPYKVFTPYYRNGCLAGPLVRSPLASPSRNTLKNQLMGIGEIQTEHLPESRVTLDDLSLLPTINWDKQMRGYWKIGERAAKQRIDEFFGSAIDRYREGRDYPAAESVSRLSPHLHWGEVSPHQLWHIASRRESNDNIQCFLTELAWREFSYYLLYHFPALPRENWNKRFDIFPWWRENKSLAQPIVDEHSIEHSENLRRWQSGLTGIPFIDAGMRELWQTGFMHNRVRMVTASFLVKNLLIHWHHGADWFWDCLVDADLASNSASWQWVAGCGADAAPYFRIFNPVTQGEKFDKRGDYTRRYVPELTRLPDKYLHKPWLAPAQILAECGVELGGNYPQPIVDLKESRERALRAFQTTRL